MSNSSTLQHYWEKAYESTETPFDAENPDEWVASLEAEGRIRGHVLDAGCGPGRTAIYLAARGYRVTGMDISENAIARARQRAAEKGSAAQFAQANLFEIQGYGNSFDTIIDIGCFHSLYDDHDRAAYAASMHRLSRAGAKLYLRAFSARNPEAPEPGMHSPNLREDQIRTAFESNGWIITELEERQIDLWISDEMTLKIWVWYAAIERT
ncbi:MAG TPA: methyltransferase domain-containing protein [Acidobacteriaceae bacterium]|nr:methyltransferase domain-containing protein [Acidobacteriaceae bacterium]